MKEGRCFNYKEKDHTPYDCPKNGKIEAISEDVSKYSDNQGKK